jgi:hypothetical protein
MATGAGSLPGPQLRELARSRTPIPEKLLLRARGLLDVYSFGIETASTHESLTRGLDLSVDVQVPAIHFNNPKLPEGSDLPPSEQF